MGRDQQATTTRTPALSQRSTARWRTSEEMQGLRIARAWIRSGLSLLSAGSLEKSRSPGRGTRSRWAGRLRPSGSGWRRRAGAQRRSLCAPSLAWGARGQLTDAPQALAARSRGSRGHAAGWFEGADLHVRRGAGPKLEEARAGAGSGWSPCLRGAVALCTDRPSLFFSPVNFALTRGDLPLFCSVYRPYYLRGSVAYGACRQAFL